MRLHVEARVFHIALHSPKIPPNTGNIIRLVANNGCTLHLIEPLAFSLDEKSLRRAGLDYHDLARVHRHRDYAAFCATINPERLFAITTQGTVHHDAVSFQPGDVLLFGSETEGLPAAIMQSIPPHRRVRIPMIANNRSLNLANAVAIVSYEAWRQNGFHHAM